MIKISQKCRYAIRGVFELAKQQADRRPVSAYKVALAQYIPKRFMEMILVELKRANIVQSIRGQHGGYVLNRKPSEITMGEIIRLVEGPIEQVECISAREGCPFLGSCVFMDTWVEAAGALAKIMDNTTIQYLVDKEAAMASNSAIPAVKRPAKRRKQPAIV